MNTTKVTIDGEIFELTGSDAAYLQGIAEYVSGKFTEVREMRKTSPTSPVLMRLLVMLNIADDYFRELTGADRLAQEAMDFTMKAEENRKRIEKLMKENAQLKSRVAELTGELNGARKELEDYVNAFDDSEE